MLTSYRLLTDLASPFIGLYLHLRLRRGREDSQRFKERLGFASATRPSGKLVWCHASSVGETMSVLALLHEIHEKHKDWFLLLTTGTVTSARLVIGRLPANTIHQYVPVDRWPYVTRFLDYWQPDCALWVESELWPNMLTSLKKRRIPAALLNGRMSEKSYKRWRFIKNSAQEMLSAFSVSLAQTENEAARFAALGLKNVKAIGNLKYAAAPLSFDAQEKERLEKQIKNRPVWVAASTHQGEDEIAFRVHHALSDKRKNLLTIIVPRHPERGEEIAALAARNNLSLAQRSKNEDITPSTAIYLADTMGELGLFYRLTKTIFLAGSFTWGGHNPIEAAQLGCAVIFGPKMDNFALMADDMLSHGAARQVKSEEELIKAIKTQFDEPQEAERLIAAAKPWVAAKHNVLEETMKILEPMLS